MECDLLCIDCGDLVLASGLGSGYAEAALDTGKAAHLAVDHARRFLGHRLRLRFHVDDVDALLGRKRPSKPRTPGPAP